MKIIKYITMVPLIAVMLTSCANDEKENSEQTAIQSSSEEKVKTNDAEDKLTKVTTYAIKRKAIKEEVNIIIDETFNSSFVSENPNAWVKIKPSDKPNQIIFAVMPNGGSNGQPIITNPANQICSGEGHLFASCVSDWLEANPNSCLFITHSDGIYSANDEGC